MPNFRDSFRTRGYRHFDRPPGLEGARRLATDERRAEKHSFYPFIRRKVETPRYKKAEHKNEKKERCVDYASHSDAAIYSWYSALLSERYEALLHSTGEPCEIAIAYRKLDGQCNIHFAQTAFDWVQAHLPCVALCFDVEGFFDAIDHDLLKREWNSLLGTKRLPLDHFRVFKSLTQYSFVCEVEVHRLFGRPKRRPTNHRSAKRIVPERLCSPQEFRTRIRDAGHIHPNTRLGMGIPQGSPMSGILSNIYMLPFDRKLKEFASSCGGFAQRYSDDILLIVPIEKCDEAKQLVFAAAEERRLKVHRNSPKLEERQFDRGCSAAPLPQPMQYLGLTFDGKNVRIRPQTWSRQCRKARSYIRRAADHALKSTHRNTAASLVHRPIYRKTFLRRFTEQGQRNFGSYANRSKRVTSSTAIKKQWKQHQKHVRRWLDSANDQNQASLEGHDQHFCPPTTVRFGQLRGW